MMTESPGRQAAACYELRVDGHLDDHWAAWFGDLNLTHESDGTTSLSGHVSDQAELHGLLMKVRDLGVTLISVAVIDPPRTALATSPTLRMTGSFPQSPAPTRQAVQNATIKVRISRFPNGRRGCELTSQREAPSISSFRYVTISCTTSSGSGMAAVLPVIGPSPSASCSAVARDCAAAGKGLPCR